MGVGAREIHVQYQRYKTAARGDPPTGLGPRAAEPDLKLRDFYAGCSAVICSSTRPLVSIPTAHSAMDAMRKVSAKVCST